MSDTTRRIFIARGIAGGCAAIAIPLATQAAPSRVEESDETAVQLGYKHDTRKVDKARFPKHSPAQTCTNCGLYQGAASDEWGGCAMFGRKQVAGPGWCLAWVKKPG